MGPLATLKVLDFSKLLPGPLGSMFLADMGADVLRVEWPEKPDMVRRVPPFVDGEATTHSYLNRSKGSLSLNLKDPRAIEIIKDLVKEYDIVLEQFRPGVMESLGIGYEQLKAVNPALIFCSISGYGQESPYRDRAGHDINYLALSGLSSYSGRRSTGPSLSGTQIADIAGGSYPAIVGILAAVIHREKTGEGQAIDISLADGALAMNAMAGAAFTEAKAEPMIEGNPLNGGSFYDYYQTGDGRWLSVGGLEPKFIQALLITINRLDLAPSFMSTKPKDQVWLKEQLKEVFLSKNQDEWAKIFASVDACVEPVLSLSEALEHPHFKEREMVVEVPRGRGGISSQIANPIRFSVTKTEYRHTGCGVGESNPLILKKLGFSEDEIDSLKKDGVFGNSATKPRSSKGNSESNGKSMNL